MYIYLKGGLVEGKIQNILIEDDLIKEVSCEDIPINSQTEVIDCSSLNIIPGVIDVHVHFRQPGAEQKADMNTESLAALAGGVTSVIDMPNNTPPCVDEKTLERKFALAQKNMHCNYSFYLGLTNDNVDKAISIANNLHLPLKLFLGSSTGNMLVDNASAIEKAFKETQTLICSHCESESVIKHNKEKYLKQEPLPYNIHSLIRDVQACYQSSSFAIGLAKKYNTPFHLAHLTTKKEISLLSKSNMEDKNITTEVSPNHLLFCEQDYKKYNNLIKCNPAIKTLEDRQALRQALKEGYIDIVSTDHAPHLIEEKLLPYNQAPSGIPSIQFSLLMMLQIMKQEKWPLSLITTKMCLNPAKRFKIKGRGEIKKGYFADLVLIDFNKKTTITKDMILSKCGWSVLMNKTFDFKIVTTFLNGKKVYDNGIVNTQSKGEKLNLF